MNAREQARGAAPYAWIAAFAGAALLLILTPLSTSTGWLLLVTFSVLAWRQQMFAVEGYLCIVAGYYWIGIANPFGADIHGVVIDSSLARILVATVATGVAAIAAGAFLGSRAAARRTVETQLPCFVRVYRAATVCLVLGLIAVAGVYLRFGAPALAPIPDVAREAVSLVLSPYTQYQWLLLDIGMCLTAIAYARDQDPSRRRARRLLAMLSIAAAYLLALYSSRILLVAPLMAAVIAWTTQGRRIPRRLILAGVLVALVVVSVGWLARLSAVGEFTLYNIDFDLSGGYAAGLTSLAAAVTIFARTAIEIFALFVTGKLPRMGGEVAFMSILAVLPGHQPELGLFRITRLMGYDGATGTTVSLFGGMYADFGLPGVIVESAMIGGLLGAFRQRAHEGDRLAGIYYAIAFTYYVATIYGGVLLDVTLLWKLWIAWLVVRYVRTGDAFNGLHGALALATVALYVFGIAHLAF